MRKYQLSFLTAVVNGDHIGQRMAGRKARDWAFRRGYLNRYRNGDMELTEAGIDALRRAESGEMRHDHLAAD
jgi:hypothetical protein